MRHKLFAFFSVVLSLATACAPKERTLHIVTTGDVHGSWFDEPYVEGQAKRTSLMSVKVWVDSLRQAVGKKNVLLLDAGDCLQGDNAPYYYNYVDTTGEHPFVQLMAYMGYDAIAVGNHDIETGHPVYDKINGQLHTHGIPFLAANAVAKDGQPYFTPYKVFRRGGLKVAVIGFTNPNIEAWLDERIWDGITFESLIPCAQEWVDRIREKEHPDVVVALTHSATGDGDGSSLEAQGLDLLQELEGVDILVCSHDHRPYIAEKNGTWLINGGARAGNVGHAVVTISGKEGKKVHGEYVRMNKNKVDPAMEEQFRPVFEAVRDFTLQPVGELSVDLRTRDAYTGMCDYAALLHMVQLEASGAQVSFVAPLTFDGTVSAGQVIFNDMFTIYPFENQLYVIKMKGSEIRDYLEYSYDNWIQTPGDNILRIVNAPDPRTGADHWSFTARTYNFDSAGGLVYTVDVTKPFGKRVKITSLADGTPFKQDEWYTVAMTSYRASGGGEILQKGAGLSKEEADERIQERLPEIREMVYQYFKKHGTVGTQDFGNRAVLGEWYFVPEKLVAPMFEKDLSLIF